MTEAEIRRWLRRFRFDPEFKSADGSVRVPTTCVCRFAGVPRQNFYSRAMTKNQIVRLTAAIEAVQAGLRWRRVVRPNGQFLRWEVNDKRFEALPKFERPKYRREGARA